MWKPLVAFAVLILLVLLGLYAGYQTTKSEGDRLDAGAMTQER